MLGRVGFKWERARERVGGRGEAMGLSPVQELLGIVVWGAKLDADVTHCFGSSQSNFALPHRECHERDLSKNFFSISIALDFA